MEWGASRPVRLGPLNGLPAIEQRGAAAQAQPAGCRETTSARAPLSSGRRGPDSRPRPGTGWLELQRDHVGAEQASCADPRPVQRPPTAGADRDQEAAGGAPEPLPARLFTYARPMSRDLVETILGSAALSRFIIADLSEPRSLPQELQAIVPNLQSVPVVPIINEGGRVFATFD